MLQRDDATPPLLTYLLTYLLTTYAVGYALRSTTSTNTAIIRTNQIYKFSPKSDLFRLFSPIYQISITKIFQQKLSFLHVAKA